MKKLLSIAMLSALALHANDTLEIAQMPPAGLLPSQIPQFIVIGSDDNGRVEGLEWLAELLESKTNPTQEIPNEKTFDGTPMTMSFYCSSMYMENDTIVTLLNRLYQNGMEMGNHTENHIGGIEFDTLGVVQKWYEIPEYTTEISACNKALINLVGVDREDIKGFRTPYGLYTDAVLTAVEEIGFTYDCSIFSGFEFTGAPEVGTNYWPYTMENGSLTADEYYPNQALGNSIGEHPGLWEMPGYALQAPTDDECVQYGAKPGLRSKINSVTTWGYDGKIGGVDFTLWNLYGMDRDESAAILRYSLDKSYEGNRAPFHYVIHSDYYSDNDFNSNNFPSIPSCEDRRGVLVDFINYAMTLKDVRFISSAQLIDWLRAPVPLTGSGGTAISNSEAVPQNCKIFSSGSDLHINVSQAGSYSITLMTMQGRIIRKFNHYLGVGNSSLNLSKEGLASQIYLVNISDENGFNLVKPLFLN